MCQFAYILKNEIWVLDKVTKGFMDIYFCYPVIKSEYNYFRHVFYTYQATNNIFTNPSVNVFIK